MGKKSEKITLVTRDGTTIIGDYFSGNGKRAVILLHMMPADRRSFFPLAGKLQEHDIPSLAIDLRGHGESEGGPDGYKLFSDGEHQASRLDVEAAADFLCKQGIERLACIGASIGSNLGLQFVASSLDADRAALLSPGLNYRGIETAPIIRDLAHDKSIYFAAAEDDSRNGNSTADETRTLFELCPCVKEIKIFPIGGHGTRIFENHPEFMDELTSWIIA